MTSNKLGANAGKTFDADWKINLSKSQVGQNRMENRRFDDITEREMCRLYMEDEMSTYALAKQFDVGTSMIISILDRNNITRRQSNYTGNSNGRNRFTVEQETEICNEYSIGNITRTDLAKKYACGTTTIRSILLRNNVKL